MKVIVDMIRTKGPRELACCLPETFLYGIEMVWLRLPSKRYVDCMDKRAECTHGADLVLLFVLDATRVTAVYCAARGVRCFDLNVLIFICETASANKASA